MISNITFYLHKLWIESFEKHKKIMWHLDDPPPVSPECHLLFEEPLTIRSEDLIIYFD